MTIAKRTVGRSAKFVLRFALLASFLAGAYIASAQYPATYPSQPQISKDGTALLLEDYADAPLSHFTHAGKEAPVDYKQSLGLVNSLRSEPSDAPLSASRFFVDDQSGTLYILDKATRKFTPYIKFGDIFPKFVSDAHLYSGFFSFVFDPGYAKNGKFYTVHVEYLDAPGSATPTNARMPALNLDGYTMTPSIIPPLAAPKIESVVVEWTDTNIRNDTFEGTARELLRVGFWHNHPMADVLFNPLAKPGKNDYGNLYIGVGDGGVGEEPGPADVLPGQLNNLMGKIVRITPDINLHPKDMLSANGRYRIPSTGPDPNPFISVPGALPEIFAYGLRNPHRLDWDIPTNTLIVNNIGVNYWEEVNIITKGAHYGYPAREGNEEFFVKSAGKTGSLMSPQVPFPAQDLIHVDGLSEPVVPVYPAAVYSHQDGDAIGSGFVYRGKLLPQLRGKYIFNDIPTARIFYADLNEMIATHGQRNHQAQIHEIQIEYKSPYDTSNKSAVKSRMYTIVAEAYAHKGGKPPDGQVLPGGSLMTTGWKDAAKTQPKTDPEGVPYGGGRADIRLAMGGEGELYVLSKGDGMIRKLTSFIPPPPTK